MRKYELTILIKPDYSEKELDKAVKVLSDLVEKNGAKIKKKVDAVKKPLSYEIKKFKEAFYLFMELEAEPEKVLEIDKKLRLEDNVIRYLIVVCP